MAKNQTEQEPQPETDDQRPVPRTPDGEAASANAALIEEQNARIAELGRMIDDLAKTVAASQAQAQRDTAFHAAAESVRAASAAVAASAASAAAARPAADPEPARLEAMHSPHPAEHDPCGGGPCECTAANCCCFEIIFKSIRVLAMQPLELDDSGANPWAELECIIFASLSDGTGAVFPSLFSPITLSKLLQHPGMWVSVERLIGEVCLPKGTTRLERIKADVVESDKGLIERATGGRDEEGSGWGVMALDCCCSTEPTLIFDVPFTSSGQGGGAVSLEFYARRKC